MEDEQTKKIDTEGKGDDKPLEKDGEVLSEYDKTLALVKRREEVTKEEKEVLDRKEKLATNSMLGGTGGGNQEVVPKEETPKEYKDKVMRGEA